MVYQSLNIIKMTNTTSNENRGTTMINVHAADGKLLGTVGVPEGTDHEGRSIAVEQAGITGWSHYVFQDSVLGQNAGMRRQPLARIETMKMHVLPKLPVECWIRVDSAGMVIPESEFVPISPNASESAKSPDLFANNWSAEQGPAPTGEYDLQLGAGRTVDAFGRPADKLFQNDVLRSSDLKVVLTKTGIKSIATFTQVRESVEEVERYNRVFNTSYAPGMKFWTLHGFRAKFTPDEIACVWELNLGDYRNYINPNYKF